MRLVIDTNVLLSGLLWHGAPHRLIEAVRSGKVALVSSPALLAELAEVIGRAKFTAILARTGHTPQSALEEVQRMAEVVTPLPLSMPICRDPDDDEVLATAIAAQAVLIVSGDEDVLNLGQFEGIPILKPAQAVGLIEAA